MPNNFMSQRVSFSDKALSGGLNSTSGPLGLGNNESSDLQNIDFGTFGSILKRNGYFNLNVVATTGTSYTGDGLYWFEYDSEGNYTSHAIKVAGGRIHKMDSLNGTWTNITGDALTAGSPCDFATFLNELLLTNGTDTPKRWIGSGTASNLTVPTGLTKASFIEIYNNYTFLGKVTVSSTSFNSRIYWSNLKTTSTWTNSDFIEVAKEDGEPITGLRVLGDRLVVFKQRSIYNVFFTGDSEIPFILPGGGKTNSTVGCVAPFSIQEVQNGLVFLSYDGLYYFDGNNSFKLSDKITKTLNDLDKTKFDTAVSLNYNTKNQYMFGLTSTAGTTRDTVIVWDYFNNAFSVYKGIAPAAMATFNIGGFQERPYFSDYAGYDYRMDFGMDDYPLKVATAIDAYYYTNWRSFEDLVNKKGIPQVVLYRQIADSLIDFAYSYDLESGDQNVVQLNFTGGGAAWDSMLWDEDEWASGGGTIGRIDLKGRGYLVRFGFKNARLGETFQIDGFGTSAQLETLA